MQSRTSQSLFLVMLCGHVLSSACAAGSQARAAGQGEAGGWAPRGCRQHHVKSGWGQPSCAPQVWDDRAGLTGGARGGPGPLLGLELGQRRQQSLCREPSPEAWPGCGAETAGARTAELIPEPYPARSLASPAVTEC